VFEVGHHRLTSNNCVSPKPPRRRLPSARPRRPSVRYCLR
jgi:hypothetical protein